MNEYQISWITIKEDRTKAKETLIKLLKLWTDSDVVFEVTPTGFKGLLVSEAWGADNETSFRIWSVNET